MTTPRLSEVEARRISGAHAPGCSHCRENGLCNVCGVPTTAASGRCTNGRCPDCHRRVCTAYADGLTHGFGDPEVAHRVARTGR